MRIREVDRVVPWHRNHPRNPRAVSLAASAVCSSPDPRAMEGARFRELVLDHARCHKVLANISEEREVAKLVEVVKEYMRLKAKHFVAKCENRAILFSYGSDSTPLLTRASFSHVLDGKRVVRNAGKAEEFLIERGFLRSTDSNGQPTMVCLGRDPLPLRDGKSAWHMFSALTRFFPLVQTLGHRGIIVSHYVFDRAMWAPLTRLVQQRHALFHQFACERGERTEAESAQMQLLDWCVSTPCANHDCQNALKWALKNSGENQEDMLKGLHVSIAALRNGMDLLHAFLPAFVQQSVSFVLARPGAREPLYNFWVALGLESIVAELCAELQAMWRNDRLEVSEDCSEDPQLFEKLSHILLQACRFKSFTDSRWLTVGDACRSLVASLSLGLSQWVQLTRENPKTSDYYLHGFSQLDAHAKRYAVVAALTSPVCDALLVDLLEDDRVAQRVDALEESLQSELDWLVSLQPLIWESLSALLGECGPATLRTQCLLAATTIAAFVKMRFLGQARQYPWRLVQGNISANIDALMDDDEVSEPTAVKIRTLARFGFNRNALVQGVQRLGDVSWTTHVHEQGHASGAAMHKIHQMHGTAMLAGRAFIHMVRPLFQLESEDKAALRFRGLEAALSKKVPARLSGKSVFLSDLLETAKRRSGGEALSNEDRKALMRQHSVLFSRLPKQAHDAYTSEAHRRAEERSRDVDHELLHIRTSLQMRKTSALVERLAEAQLSRLSNCRFVDEDFDAMVELWQSPAFSTTKSAALREAALEPPRMPSAAVRGRLSEVATTQEARRPFPAWCAQVCQHREFFAETILLVGDGSKAFAFLFALQQPYFAAFLQVEPFHSVGEASSIAGVSSQGPITVLALSYDHCFWVDWRRIVFAEDIECDENGSLGVLSEVAANGASAFVSNSNRIPFDVFVSSLPHKVVRDSGTSTEKKPGAEPIVVAGLQKYKWLEKYTHNDETQAEDRRASSSTADHGRPAGVTLDDIEAEEVFAELEVMRMDWYQSLEKALESFKTGLLGGKWTKENIGRVADAYRGYAASAEAKAWCTLYRMQPSMRFNISTYGERTSSALALHWASRMEYLYGSWCDQGGRPLCIHGGGL